MTEKKKTKKVEKPTKLHEVEVVKEVPSAEEINKPIIEEIKSSEIVAPIPQEAEKVNEPVDVVAEAQVDEVVVQSPGVPELDIAKPLPSLEEPKVDEVMIVAKREWYLGIFIFVMFIAIVGVVGWGYNKLIQSPTQSSQKVEVVASNTPTSTLTSQEAKQVYAVWNGSGVAGAAGDLATKLKGSGLEVVETKNAPTIVEGNQVELSPQLADQKAPIETMLKGFGINNVIWSTLISTDLSYNVKIIIGK